MTMAIIVELEKGYVIQMTIVTDLFVMLVEDARQLKMEEVEKHQMIVKVLIL